VKVRQQENWFLLTEFGRVPAFMQFEGPQCTAVISGVLTTRRLPAHQQKGNCSHLVQPAHALILHSLAQHIHHAPVLDGPTANALRLQAGKQNTEVSLQTSANVGAKAVACTFAKLQATAQTLNSIPNSWAETLQALPPHLQPRARERQRVCCKLRNAAAAHACRQDHVRRRVCALVLQQVKRACGWWVTTMQRA